MTLDELLQRIKQRQEDYPVYPALVGRSKLNEINNNDSEILNADSSLEEEPMNNSKREMFQKIKDYLRNSQPNNKIVKKSQY